MVFIPRLPKLPNDIGWGKLNRFYESKKWIVSISRHFIGKGPSEPLQKSIVTFVRQSSREPDLDNNYASVKPVLDSLKKCGIIADDSPKHVDLRVTWLKSGNNDKGLIISIDEI